jgi:hypothetical protein
MHRQIGKIGAIRGELDGTACPFCGSHKYQLASRPQTKMVFPPHFPSRKKKALWMVIPQLVGLALLPCPLPTQAA